MPDQTVPEPPAKLVAAALDYIASAEWMFAKTMPNNPHWYAVRQVARKAGIGPGHEALYVLCRDYPLRPLVAWPHVPLG